MHDVDLRLHLEIFHREVAGTAVAGGSVVELPGLRLGFAHEVGERRPGQVGIDRDHVRHRRDERHRDEILHGVVRQRLAEQRGIHREHADVPEDHRVAVGRRALHFLHRDVAGASRPVVDVDLLPERGRQLRGQRSRDDLGRAARRERHDETDRLRGPRLRQRHLGGERDDDGGNGAEAGHGFLGGIRRCIARGGQA
jgi:hypothetical protein